MAEAEEVRHVSMDDAYAVQLAGVAERIERHGGEIVGWKIDLTSKAMQQMLNRAFTHLHLPLLQVLMDFAHTAVLSIAQPPHQGDHIQTTFSMWQCPPPFFFWPISLLVP